MDFYNRINTFLEALYNKLDGAYGDCSDITLTDGVLRLVTDDNKQLIINRHLASEELWMASPVSGGTHYAFNAECADWLNTKTGASFEQQLRADLNTLFPQPQDKQG